VREKGGGNRRRAGIGVTENPISVSRVWGREVEPPHVQMEPRTETGVAPPVERSERGQQVVHGKTKRSPHARNVTDSRSIPGIEPERGESSPDPAGNTVDHI